MDDQDHTGGTSPPSSSRRPRFRVVPARDITPHDLRPSTYIHVVPTISRDGTPQDVLLARLDGAREALRGAMMAFANATPSERDFPGTVDGEPAYDRAMAQHRGRVARLRALIEEYDQLFEDTENALPEAGHVVAARPIFPDELRVRRLTPAERTLGLACVTGKSRPCLADPEWIRAGETSGGLCFCDEHLPSHAERV